MFMCYVCVPCLIVYQRKLKEAMKRRAQADEAKFQSMMGELEAGRPHADAVGCLLSEHEERQRRKQQHLFNEWDAKIFRPIQVYIGRLWYLFSVAICHHINFNLV